MTVFPIGPIEMSTRNKWLSPAALLAFAIACPAPGATRDRNWPAWRGPNADGVAHHANPPTKWSESKNVRWKFALPGKGHSTPIIWDSRVFITVAVPFGEKKPEVYSKAEGAHDNFPVSQNHKFVVVAIDRVTGKQLWEREVKRELPHEGGHYTGSLASNSPLTDGKHVYAHFGSRGLHCLTLEGEIVWSKYFGRMDTRHAHGEGSSPALHGNTLVVNWDHSGFSFVVALDKRDGRELWKADRDEMTSWSTPLIVSHKGRQQVIVSATGAVRAYDLETGEVVWKCTGLSRNVVASPVAGDGMVFVSNSYDWQAMMGIVLDGAKGDITETKNVAWKISRLTPYVPSPLLHDGTLYFLRHNHNILSCLDPQTGKDREGPFRLPGLREIFASPVAAKDRVYIPDRSGVTLVFSHGKDPQPIALNKLDDKFSASPAIVGNELFLRGEKFLYCLAEEQQNAE
ncbi:MAG: outer membrane protein assembly factor BamB [Limisphaerales bacterium]